ncbi:MAG TPA: trypsin-like peptidase domain-containing protein, partial [Pirellulaceae bacterium]|nr:trypsin-like peptidase domain-containing protein [Pirellulaceae bacterium]
MEQPWTEQHYSDATPEGVVSSPSLPIESPPYFSQLPAESPPRLPGRAANALTWLIAMLAVLLAVGFFAPRLAEEIQYSLVRGRQRAEHEHAGTVLDGNSLAELSRASQMVTLRIAPSVVIVNVNSGTPVDNTALHDEAFKRFSAPTPDSLGQGSGVVVDANGLILTNYHVVRDAQEIRVTLSDGRRLRATPLGVDSLTDLALLKVEASNLIAAEWGDSDALPVGSLIWAVGSPFGLERSVSFGILSAKNRGGVAGSPHQDFLQSDAAVNPGNSGGPLVDVTGRVVGINTAIVGQTYSGISFAVPSNVARDVAERLKGGGYVPRGWLGVELADLSQEQATTLGLEDTHGAVVAKVVEDGRNSPALRAGILPGDVVLRWNGLDVKAPATLSQLVAKT